MRRFLWAAVGAAALFLLGARVEMLEIGSNGVYDGAVKIERADGELVFSDSELQGVSLSDLASAGVSAEPPLAITSGTVSLDSDASFDSTGIWRFGSILVDETTLVTDSVTNRVGIGTASPTVSLDVLGAAKVSGAITGAGLAIDSPTLVVDASNDRVGIGTASPAYKLNVEGSSTGVITMGISNTGTSGSGAAAFLRTSSFNSVGGIYQFASTYSNNANLAATTCVYNNTAGGIALWDGQATGGIKFMGGTSAIDASIDASGNMTMAGDLNVDGGDVKTASGNLTINPASGGNAVIQLGGAGQNDIVDFACGIYTAGSVSEVPVAFLQIMVGGATYYLPLLALEEE